MFILNILVGQNLSHSMKTTFRQTDVLIEIECNDKSNSFEKEVLDFLLIMFSNSSVPHSCAADVVKSFEKYVFLLGRKCVML